MASLAPIAALLLHALTPAAVGQGILPPLCEGWVGGCLDAVTPGASALLPAMLHPPAEEPVAQAASASPAEPATTPQGGTTPGSPAAADLPPATIVYAGIALGLLILLALVVGGYVSARRARNEHRSFDPAGPRGPSRTRLADALRAQAMQDDLDAWRASRAARGRGASVEA